MPKNLRTDQFANNFFCQSNAHRTNGPMCFFVEHLSQQGVLSLASKKRENPGDEVVLVDNQVPYDPTTGEANENVGEN